MLIKMDLQSENETEKKILHWHIVRFVDEPSAPHAHPESNMIVDWQLIKGKKIPVRFFGLQEGYFTRERILCGCDCLSAFEVYKPDLEKIIGYQLPVQRIIVCRRMLEMD